MTKMLLQHYISLLALLAIAFVILDLFSETTNISVVMASKFPSKSSTQLALSDTSHQYPSTIKESSVNIEQPIKKNSNSTSSSLNSNLNSSTVLADQNEISFEDWSANQAELEQYWLNKRELFFNETSFEIPKKTVLLVGNHFEGKNLFHLPFWFDFNMFKNVSDKSYINSSIELKRHHIYINNCIDIVRNLILKRIHQPNNFTFIDLAEDWTEFENYNEEWNEIDLNLTRAELSESPIAKAIRLIMEDLRKCTERNDKVTCILYLVELEERFGPPMKLRYPFEDEKYRSLMDLDAAEDASAEFADSLISKDGKLSYWLLRRQDFYNRTSFLLSPKVKSLIIPNKFSSPTTLSTKSALDFIIGNSSSTIKQLKFHLPFWFDYEVFKRMVTRINETPQEELKSHHKYIESCIEIWNDTASDRLGLLDYDIGGINSHVDITPRTCLSNCNPFDYDLTEDELKESPVDKAIRLVKEELDNCTDKRRILLLLAELEEKFDFPRAKGMHYPFETEKSGDEFWKYIEDKEKSVAEFVKKLPY